MGERTPLGNSTEPLQKRAARGGIVSGLNFALSIVLNLLQVPLLLRFWDQDVYGLWLSVAALASSMTPLDGGHNVYVGNLLNRFYVEAKDRFRLTLASAVLMTTFTAGIQILGILALCGSGYAAKWLNIPATHSWEFSIAVIIYSVGGITTNSIGSVLVRLFAPTGNFVRAICWGMGMRLAQFLTTVAAASMGWGLIPTTTLSVVIVLVCNVFMFWDIRRLFPEYFPWWKGGEWRLGFQNFTKSFLLMLVLLMEAVSIQGVVLIVTNILGAAIVPLFTTLRTLANTSMQGAGFLLNPIQPDVVRYHVEKQPEKLRAAFAIFWLISGFGINLSILLGLFFVEPIYAFWTQGVLLFDRMLFAWLAACVLIRTLGGPFVFYLSSINQLKSQLAAGAVRTVIIVVGVMVLAPKFKLSGVGAMLFFGELFGSLIIPAVYSLIELRKLGDRCPNFGIYWPCISTFLAVLCLFWYGIAGGDGAIVIGCISGAVFIAGLLQWRRLSDEDKGRLLDIIPFLKYSQ